jgi:hypothetical protein
MDVGLKAYSDWVLTISDTSFSIPQMIINLTFGDP